MTNRLLRVGEVQERLSLGKTFVYRLIQTGQLRSVKVSRRARRVPISEVERFIEQKIAEAKAEYDVLTGNAEDIAQ